MSRLPPLREGWRVEIRTAIRGLYAGRWFWWANNPDYSPARSRWRESSRGYVTEAEAILAAKRAGADEVYRSAAFWHERGCLERDSEGRAKVEASGVVVHEATR